MAGVTKRIDQFTQIEYGTSNENNIKFNDNLLLQHVDTTSGKNQSKKTTFSQTLCEPYAECTQQQTDGIYTAECLNFPDFNVTYIGSDGTTNKNLIGLKVKVKFTEGCNFGSVSSGTYPSLRIGNSQSFPMLAQGKTMATGAWTAGQTLEFTIIPYNNSLAFDSDSNIRESSSDYTIHTDGKTVYNKRLYYNVSIPESYFSRDYIRNAILSNIGSFGDCSFVCVRDSAGQTLIVNLDKISNSYFYFTVNSFYLQIKEKYNNGQWISEG